MTIQNPVQGPPTVFKKRHRPLSKRFLTLMDDLRQWRSDDHEDNFVLPRLWVIELIEGVDTLQAANGDGRPKTE